MKRNRRNNRFDATRGKGRKLTPHVKDIEKRNGTDVARAPETPTSVSVSPELPAGCSHRLTINVWCWWPWGQLQAVSTNWGKWEVPALHHTINPRETCSFFICWLWNWPEDICFIWCDLFVTEHPGGSPYDDPTVKEAEKCRLRGKSISLPFWSPLTTVRSYKERKKRSHGRKGERRKHLFLDFCSIPL